MPSINVVEVPSDIDPSNATTYFPEESNLVKWADAHINVPNANHRVIPKGTRLALLAEIVPSRTSGELTMEVADASCSADSFRLTAGADELAPYVGSMVAVALTVDERTGNHYCHGSSYIVHSVALAALPLNPSVEELRRMKYGTHFVVQGKFVEYYEETPGRSVADTSSHKTRGRIVIDTSSGQMTLDSSRPSMKEPRYDGGVLENLRDKRMISGETIRISGFVSKGERLDDLPAGVATVGYNQPYLLEPDARRRDDYIDLRSRVEDTIDVMRYQIGSQKWANARATFVALRKQELTRDETRQVIAIMEAVPIDHRSVYYSDKARDGDIKRLFGVDPETLDRDGFLAYARDILLGTRERSSKKGSGRQSELLQFWRPNHTVLSKESLAELLLATIPVRMARLEQCSDVLDDYWDDYYLLEDCVSTFRYWGEGLSDEDDAIDVDPRLVSEIVNLVEHCIEKGYYHMARDAVTDQPCPRRLKGVLAMCLRALADTYMCQPVVREQVTPHLVNDWAARLERAGADSYDMSELRRSVPRR